MVNIAVAPIILNDTSLVIGADNYEAHVSTVKFEPASSIVKWKGLTPLATYNFSTMADWTGVLSFAQDWVTANALSAYLLANEGKAVTAVFKPKKPPTGTAPTWTATIICTPGTIGGDVDTVPVATVTVAVQGRPVLTVA